MYKLLTLLFLGTKLFGWEHTDWLKQVEQRKDEESVVWLRSQLNPKEKKVELTPDSKPCESCFKGKIEIPEPKILVFISFSVPKNIWLSLSQEMEKENAVFVLRGVPENSFKSFAKEIINLKEEGLKATVQIQPELFKEYEIDSVPAFVFKEGNLSHKVCGAISMKYAQSLTDGLLDHIENNAGKIDE